MANNDDDDNPLMCGIDHLPTMLILHDGICLYICLAFVYTPGNVHHG